MAVESLPSFAQPLPKLLFLLCVFLKGFYIFLGKYVSLILSYFGHERRYCVSVFFEEVTMTSVSGL